MSDVLILRHGPTQWNAIKQVQGLTDIPLSPIGRTEVSKWSVPSEYKNFHCVSSPLCRAVETARILGFEPEVNEQLREMSWGQWEGRKLSELREELGQAMVENEARGLDFQPPGGESPRDTQQRLRPWLRSLVRPTLAVAHKGVIRALYAMASDWDMCSKPKTRMIEPAAHLFGVDGNGQPFVKCMNIKLGGG